MSKTFILIRKITETVGVKSNILFIFWEKVRIFFRVTNNNKLEITLSKLKFSNDILLCVSVI